jgi:hypothetical protein
MPEARHRCGRVRNDRSRVGADRLNQDALYERSVPEVDKVRDRRYLDYRPRGL